MRRQRRHVARTHVRTLSPAQNGPDQWLATRRLSTPLGFIASPLHRVVSSLVKQGRTKSCRLRDKSTRLAVSWPAMIRSHMTFE